MNWAREYQPRLRAILAVYAPGIPDDAEVTVEEEFETGPHWRRGPRRIVLRADWGRGATVEVAYTHETALADFLRDLMSASGVSDSLEAFVRVGDEMTWPHPSDPNETEWALRYGTPTREDLMYAASVISAYKQLVSDTWEKRRFVLPILKQAQQTYIPED